MDDFFTRSFAAIKKKLRSQKSFHFSVSTTILARRARTPSQIHTHTHIRAYLRTCLRAHTLPQPPTHALAALVTGDAGALSLGIILEPTVHVTHKHTHADIFHFSIFKHQTLNSNFALLVVAASFHFTWLLFNFGINFLAFLPAHIFCAALFLSRRSAIAWKHSEFMRWPSSADTQRR